MAYMDHARYAESLRTTLASTRIVTERFAHMVPPGTVAIVVRDPHLAYAKLLTRLHPEALRPEPVLG